MDPLLADCRKGEMALDKLLRDAPHRSCLCMVSKKPNHAGHIFALVLTQITGNTIDDGVTHSPLLQRNNRNTATRHFYNTRRATLCKASGVRKANHCLCDDRIFLHTHFFMKSDAVFRG